MAAEPVDLLVIGGGITGAGIARDAALRGFRTALVDQGDFGHGTSSRSSRLIHGGLRYLEQFNFGLVFEASHERRVLLRIAPHLVRPLRFLFPVYQGGRVPPWKLRAGMWLYDLLSLFRNVHAHSWLSAKAVQKAEPGLRGKGLRGAAVYYDAQADDARLVIATIRSAAEAGALVANYTKVTSFAKANGRIDRVVIRDMISDSVRSLRVHTVVNATGPWVDKIRRLDTANAPPLLKTSKGAHVIVPRARLGLQHEAVTLLSPLDGRVMFVLPWNDLAYIGTTETEEDVTADDVHASGADVTYLLRSANAIFPSARLGPKDVLATWAGLRPLLAPEHDAPAGQVSREHRIVESADGLITIAGGKLTTHRIMARDVVDLVAERLRRVDGRAIPPRPATDQHPLPGGEIGDVEVLIDATKAREVPEATARHLVHSYGSEAAAVLNLVSKNKVLGRPLVEGRPEIRAEVVHAVEREMAMRLSDVLIRRLHLFYEDPGHAAKAAPAVAHKMGELLGWNAARQKEEVAEYQDEIARATAFLKQVRTSGPVS
jgi:glycerol-3-phosphate dehydrogenase